VKALDRKMLRDLWRIRSQAVTLALVVASAVAGFITTYSAQDSLAASRDLAYVRHHFADVFGELKRAPLQLMARVIEVSGVAKAEASVSMLAQIDLPGVSDPITGRIVGINPRQLPALNQVYLRAGRMIGNAGGSMTDRLEVLVSEGFAHARQLKPGDEISMLLNGKHQALLVAGIALSPDTLFAGLIGAPDLRGFGVFWLDEKALARASDMEGAFNHLAIRLAPGASEAQVIDEVSRLMAPFGGSRAYGRSEHMSHKMLEAEIREQRVMGTVLPSIFLAVAAFLLNVVLGRQITLQREQIAALKALGYDNLSITLHYLKQIVLIVLAGIMTGVLVGYWLGQQLTVLYQQVFHFPVFVYQVRAELILVAFVATLLTGTVAAWGALRAVMRLSPAEAMRPPSPGLYRQSLIEPLAQRLKLSPGLRMILRNMHRHRWRSVFTVAGIMASMAVLIAGTFSRDSIALLIDTQFRHALRGDVSVYLINPRPATVAALFAHLPEVTAVEASRNIPVRLVHARHEWRGMIQGKAEQPQLHRILDVERRAYAPPVGGLLLTDRLAERLHVKPGDAVRMEIQEGERRTMNLIVIATVREMMGMNAYMERRSLNHLVREGDMANQLTLTVQHGTEPALLEALRHMPQVAMAISKAVMLANIESITARNLLIISTVLTLFATVIAIGVVYNQARIALAERSWELASLRVLGFTRGEVSALLLGELGIAMIAALPLGLIGGYLLASTIVQMTKTEEFYFALVIRPPTYAYAALCVALAAAASAWIVARRIAALDLVGVLKARD
jgi:putative ABC transport system permease protein